MDPGMNLVINGCKVRIERNDSDDLISMYYEHKRTGNLSIVQQFQMTGDVEPVFLWDETTSRFVLTTKKPPLGTAAFERTQSNKMPKRAASEGTIRTESSPDERIYWSET
jgi:hypothetical protein